MATLSEVKKQIESNSEIKNYVSYSEIKELPKNLRSDEVIKDIVSGFFAPKSGLMVATTQRLLFVEKGFFSGSSVEKFDYDKISSIKYTTGMILADVRFYYSGKEMIIDDVTKGDAKRFTETVQKMISGNSVDIVKSNEVLEERPLNKVAPKSLKVDDLLWEFEEIEYFISGSIGEKISSGNCLLVATNKRFIFVEKGAFWGRNKVLDFGYKDVNSIEYKTGFMFDEVTVKYSGNSLTIYNAQGAEYFTRNVRALMTKLNEAPKQISQGQNIVNVNVNNNISDVQKESAPEKNNDLISQLEQLKKIKRFRNFD